MLEQGLSEHARQRVTRFRPFCGKELGSNNRGKIVAKPYRSCRGGLRSIHSRELAASWRRKASYDEELESNSEPSRVGEDAAKFDADQQSTSKWTFFTVELGVVLAILYAVWIAPGGWAEDFLEQLKHLSSNSEIVMVSIFAVFAVVHSGLAYLRPWGLLRSLAVFLASDKNTDLAGKDAGRIYISSNNEVSIHDPAWHGATPLKERVIICGNAGEEAIGARAYRVIFAAVSLPLAVVAVVYFINHRYDGLPLWNLRRQPYIHQLVWILNFISFYFLYPSTFNLLEVAAVDEPKLHMWETGVMRITRHPQAFGQALWCAAHTLWIGSSFMITTSAALMAHHLFACWHGDFRLERKHGEAFKEVKGRTSIVPGAAILDGRQKLPKDYYKEFLRLPYYTLTVVTLGAYFAHPLMQQASAWLGW